MPNPAPGIRSSGLSPGGALELGSVPSAEPAFNPTAATAFDLRQAEVRIVHSKLTVIESRLRLLYPQNDQEAMEQCSELFDHLSSNRHAASHFAWLLEDGSFRHFRSDAVRAQTVTILGKQHPEDPEALLTCATELLHRGDRVQSAVAAADVLNRNPIIDQSVANRLVSVHHRLLLAGEHEGDLRRHMESRLSLLEPRFAVPPDEKLMAELRGDILSVARREEPISPRVLDLISRTGSAIGRETLEFLARGIRHEPIELIDRATSNLGQRLRGAFYATATLFGASLLVGAAQSDWTEALGRCAAIAASVAFVVRPVLAHWWQELTNRWPLHPIVGTRAVEALKKMGSSPENEEALVRIAQDSFPPFQIRKSAIEGLVQIGASERGRALIENLSLSPSPKERMIAAHGVMGLEEHSAREIARRLFGDHDPEVRSVALRELNERFGDA